MKRIVYKTVLSLLLLSLTAGPVAAAGQTRQATAFLEAVYYHEGLSVHAETKAGLFSCNINDVEKLKRLFEFLEQAYENKVEVTFSYLALDEEWGMPNRITKVSAPGLGSLSLR